MYLLSETLGKQVTTTTKMGQLLSQETSHVRTMEGEVVRKISRQVIGKDPGQSLSEKRNHLNSQDIAGEGK